jgi:metal-responsive CopG/Arc/MetJ family transcriptional regulator
MAKGDKRVGAGRPPGNPELAARRVSVTLSPRVLLAIDDFAVKNKLSRSAAIERLCRVGLKKL